MVIFHSYVSLPEGMPFLNTPQKMDKNGQNPLADSQLLPPCRHAMPRRSFKCRSMPRRIRGMAPLWATVTSPELCLQIEKAVSYVFLEYFDLEISIRKSSES